MKDELQAWPTTLAPLLEVGQRWDCAEGKMGWGEAGYRGRHGRAEGKGAAHWGHLLNCSPRRSCYRPQ